VTRGLNKNKKNEKNGKMEKWKKERASG